MNVVFFYKSNWQNELLRLQRRNKFICALMVFMQELGIEGPRAGQKASYPFYISQQPGAMTMHGQVPRGAESNQHMSTVMEETGTSQDASHVSKERVDSCPDATIPRHHQILRTHPSILRRRGESVSSMVKRVDFSLGMRDVASANITGDVYDDVAQPPMPQIRAVSEFRRENESRERTRSMSTTSAASHEHNSGPSSFNLRRVSTESARLRNPGVHRNRFFGSVNIGRERADLMMEQGMASIQGREKSGHWSTRPIDQRTGIISPQAVRSESHDIQ